MGLDMYLTKEIYIGANYEYNKIKGKIEITRDGEVIPINFNKVYKIIEETAYWRKSNMIHKWFVDNVQNGNDDCKKYYVSKAKLIELVELCKKVLKNHKITKTNKLAEKLLPTQEGFFFGDTSYEDGYYYQDLQQTIDMLEPVIEDKEEEKLSASYYYQSSW